MKQKGFALILILILIAMVVIGYFGYKNLWPKISGAISPQSYEDCLKSPRSIVQQSFPAVCVTKSGTRFTQSSTSDPTEGKFCGGIAANLPENKCPDGFFCKLDGNNPDASGHCIKE